MSSWRHIIMSNQRHAAAALVRDAIFAAPHGSVLVLEEPGKSRLQENKYHPMVRDIASSCEFSGRRYTEHSWKRLLVEAFVNVLRKDAFARGEDDPFPGDVDLVEGLDGEVVALGEQTRTFTRTQSSDFIEYLYSYGAEQNPPVEWGAAARRVIEEMLARKRQEALHCAP
jgi:hypothetical protein